MVKCVILVYNNSLMNYFGIAKLCIVCNRDSKSVGRGGYIMKKRYLLIVLIIFIVIVIWSYLNLEALGAYTQINKGDFQIEYILENGFKGYDIKMQISSDGSFIKKTSYDYNVPEKIEKGYYPKADVAKFVKYAIRHNLFKMNDNMSSNVLDGRNIFFIIRVGEKSIKAGGGEPQDISNDFREILKQFEKLCNDLK